MCRVGRRCLCAAVLGALLAAGCGKDSGGAAGKGRPRVTIRGRTWVVRLALTPGERQQGLSKVYSLGEDEGMLFIFAAPERQSFWMKDCIIPLDLAFVDGDRRVVATYTMPVPAPGATPDEYDSGEPVLYALEANAGQLARAGVRKGDVVQFSAEVDRAAKGGRVR